MKNFKSESGHTFPYVNLNGNSGKSLASELRDIRESLREVIGKVAKADYANGRNATSNEHTECMQEEKIKALTSLKEIEEYFLQIAIGISDQ